MYRAALKFIACHDKIITVATRFAETRHEDHFFLGHSSNMNLVIVRNSISFESNLERNDDFNDGIDSIRNERICTIECCKPGIESVPVSEALKAINFVFLRFY